MQQLYSWNFHPTKRIPTKIQSILSKMETIDQIITKSAPNRPIEQINQIDLAILRLAVFELIISKEPVKVIIDEAIELAKEYGSDSSASFVNGALGQAIKLKTL